MSAGFEPPFMRKYITTAAVVVQKHLPPTTVNLRGYPFNWVALRACLALGSPPYRINLIGRNSDGAGLEQQLKPYKCRRKGLRKIENIKSALRSHWRVERHFCYSTAPWARQRPFVFIPLLSFRVKCCLC